MIIIINGASKAKDDTIFKYTRRPIQSLLINIMLLRGVNAEQMNKWIALEKFEQFGIQNESLDCCSLLIMICTCV